VISQALSKIADNYLKEKNNEITGNDLASFIRSYPKKDFSEILKNLNANFLFKGSAGIHKTWADVPWLAILDEDVTTSTQNGYYIVYLFSVDMKRVYLSLNQGITLLLTELGQPKAINELERRAQFIRDRVPEYKKYFNFDSIDLSSLLSKSHRPKMYEPGHSFGVSYDMQNIPAEEKLQNDLINISKLYILLTTRGGLDTDLKGYDYLPDNIDEEPVEERKKYITHRVIERNSKTVKLVKKVKGYICEACGFDFVKFYGKISLNKKNEPYIEAHHLIPLSSLNEGEKKSYDIEKDFSVLCSNCHRMVHKKNPPLTIEELKKFINKN